MELEINSELKGERVDKVLANYFNLSRKKISEANIYINGKLVKSNTKTKEFDKVILDLAIEEKIEKDIRNIISLDVVYEDKYLAVIDKPYDLVVHPSETFTGDTLVGALLNRFSKLSDIYEHRNGIVHRLDKDTSGLIIIAKDNDTHIKLQEMFKNHSVEKTYLAILKGNFKYETVRVESYIGRDKKDRKKISENTSNGRLAISIFKLIKKANNMALVSVNILTGRTHQIRVHSKKLNCHVLGDKVYSKDKSNNRQQLHSYMLSFTHPITNELISLKAKIPKDMMENIKKYGLEDENVGIY